MGLGMLAVLAPLQLVVGDLHGLNTSRHQPAKVAAMEGHWDGSKPAPLILFAWPDEKEERNHAQVAIPKLGSLIITHEPNGLFPGLKDFAPQDRPPVKPVFFSFRLMVGLGLLMIAAGLIGAFLWWRRRLFDADWYLKPLTHAWPLGFIAILAGWTVTETGRQPWIAYGVLRTADAVSPVTAVQVATSLALFIIVYSVVFSIGIWYISRMIAKGPRGVPAKPDDLPNRPLSAGRDVSRDTP
jgi:cytochrome d ubiquinol oxidase subunit I